MDSVAQLVGRDTCFVLPSPGVLKLWNFNAPTDAHEVSLEDDKVKNIPSSGWSALKFLQEYRPGNPENKKIKLVVSVTIYNEPKKLVKRTIESVQKNVEEFAKDYSSGGQLLTPDEIAVFLICDGIQKISEDVIEYINELTGEDLDAFSRKDKFVRLVNQGKEEDDNLRRKGQKPNAFPEMGAFLYHTRIDHAKHGPTAYLSPKIVLNTSPSRINLHTNNSPSDSPSNMMHHLSPETAHGTPTNYPRLQPGEQEESPSQKRTPLFTNFIVCMKATNGGKLSSHLWLFLGFCEYLKPDYVALLDGGTIVAKDALVEFYKELLVNEKVGGVAGFMSSLDEDDDDDDDDGTNEEDAASLSCLHTCKNAVFHWFKWFFRINVVNAQLYEYTYGHILDKSFESLTGFIHVLPGAFSAYRYKAISDFNMFTEYFDSILAPNNSNVTCAEGNRRLAEDRIMCLWIYCFKGHDFRLKYLPTSWAWTDLPSTLPELMSQRRRWLNGTWFALLDTIREHNLVSQSTHKWDIIGFWFNISYSIVNLASSYLTIALFYSTCNVMFIALAGASDTSGFTPSQTVVNAFLLCVVGCIYMSLMFKIDEAPLKMFFKLISAMLGFYYFILFGAVGYFTAMNIIDIASDDDKGSKKTETLGNAKILFYYLLVTIGAHAVPLIFYPGRIFDIMRGLPSYLFYTPLYQIIMPTYSFCRFDDLSWGTKGAGDHFAKGNQKEQNKKNIEYKDFKVQHVVTWILVNLVVALLMIQLNKIPEKRNQYVVWYGGVLSALLGVKGVGAVIYSAYFRIDRLLCMKRRLKNARRYERRNLQLS